MPELPEVKTVIDNIKLTCLNKTIKDFVVFKSKILKEFTFDYFKNNLINQKIINVTNKGKLIIFVLSNNIFLYSHLRMEGKYKYYDSETTQSLHCMFKLVFNDNSELHYNDSRMFGTLHIRNYNDEITKNLLEPYHTIAKEPKDINVVDLYNKVKNSSVAIKTKLLDQTLIAGIGNIYADEVLFAAKIHPKTSTKNISLNDWRMILKLADEIMNKSYLNGGTTIHSFESFNNKIGNYQKYLMVHGTNQNNCKICNSRISKIKVNGRGTYFCPKCQMIKEGNKNE